MYHKMKSSEEDRRRRVNRESNSKKRAVAIFAHFGYNPENLSAVMLHAQKAESYRGCVPSVLTGGPNRRKRHRETKIRGFLAGTRSRRDRYEPRVVCRFSPTRCGAECRPVFTLLSPQNLYAAGAEGSYRQGVFSFPATFVARYNGKAISDHPPRARDSPLREG